MSLIVASYFGIVVSVQTLPVPVAVCEQSLASVTARTQAEVVQNGGVPEEVEVTCVSLGEVRIQRNVSV